MERPRTLNDTRILKHEVATDEIAEVTNPDTEQDWHEADADLVNEAEVERLLDDVGAGDRDELLGGDRLRGRDRLFDAARKGRTRKPLIGLVGRLTMGHDDNRGAGRVVVTPAVCLIEQPTPGDDCTAA